MGEQQTTGEAVRIRFAVGRRMAGVDAHRSVAETDQLRARLPAAEHPSRANLRDFPVHTIRWATCQQRLEHAREEGRRGAKRDG